MPILESVGVKIAAGIIAAVGAAIAGECSEANEGVEREERDTYESGGLTYHHSYEGDDYSMLG